ncbi:flavin reductase (NADPH)-like [Oratosquilla oratoria]|uniref:flavin reductase (NADPH)-like n=1 Tax=Oratosquilla oratoria TaxID=337810 RepID=UPI003F76C00C
MDAAKKLRVVVLGATGKTGVEVVQQAIQEGHTVTAVVRDPSKITFSDVNLRVVVGDVFDSTSLTAKMVGQDAVISCLGFSRNPQPVTGYTESCKAIVTAMRTSNVNRLVCMTSWYTDVQDTSRLGFMIKWMLLPFLRPVLTNMKEMEDYISTCSDINYTVVRPPGLGTGARTKLPMSVAEGETMVDTGSSFNQTSRSDVAAFMLSCLMTSNYNKKMIAITTNKAKNK